MTEAEWLNCPDPRAMLDASTRSLDDRKARLFGAACCRRIAQFFKVKASSALLETSESYADGAARPDELGSTFEKAQEAPEALFLETATPAVQSSAAAVLGLGPELDLEQVFEFTIEAVREFADETARRRLAESEHTHWPWRERDLRDAGDMAAADEIEYQAALLRDVIGNPFRRVTFHRAWRTSTAVALGRRMYESRDFTPMPNLADALRRAGCECAEVLAHCRGPGPHVRGCWVVDLVLGTE